VPHLAAITSTYPCHQNCTLENTS